MTHAPLREAETAVRADPNDSPTAFSNWRLSDREAQREALRRVARIRSRRLRLHARRRLVNRLYLDPLPIQPRATNPTH